MGGGADEFFRGGGGVEAGEFHKLNELQGNLRITIYARAGLERRGKLPRTRAPGVARSPGFSPRGGSPARRFRLSERKSCGDLSRRKAKVWSACVLVYLAVYERPTGPQHSLSAHRRQAQPTESIAPRSEARR